MKIRMMMVVAALAAVAMVASMQAADKKDKLAGVKCPISGKDVKAGKTADYKGGKIYFCCPGCSDKFAKNTEKFATKANHQLVATGQARQGGCPISGSKLDPKTVITVAVAKICFCCDKCKAKAEKATGDDQLTMLFGDKAFEKGKFKVASKKK